jgi:hypothetical protein
MKLGLAAAIRWIFIKPKLSDSSFSEKVDGERYRFGTIDYRALKMKPMGFADLTTSSALDIAAHRPRQRDDICLEYAASSTIAQLGLK